MEERERIDGAESFVDSWPLRLARSPSRFGYYRSMSNTHDSDSIKLPFRVAAANFEITLKGGWFSV